MNKILIIKKIIKNYINILLLKLIKKMFKKLFILVLCSIFITVVISEKKSKELDKALKRERKVLDIKQYVDCALATGHIPQTLNLKNVLEHKKEYNKQIAYLRRVMPKTKEIKICRKNAFKTVPNLLDIEQFAY